MMTQTRTAGLKSGQLLVLWTVRTWVKAHMAGSDTTVALEAAYAMAGAPSAVPQIDLLMGVIGSHALRCLTVNCPKCQSVTPCEALIITAIADFQQGRSGHADRILSHFVGAGVAPLAARPGRLWAMALLDAQYPVAPVPDATVAPAHAPAAARYMRPLPETTTAATATVH